MPIIFKENITFLENIVGIEEAEELLKWLETHKEGAVDLSNCSHLHTAIVQILMVARNPVIQLPTNAQLALWLRTAFQDYLKENKGEL